MSALTTLAATAAVAASLFGPVYSPPTDPTEFRSLRLEPFEAVTPDEAEWLFIATVTYFNQWNGTWHTRRSHEDRGLPRQPIQDEELRALEAAFPRHEIFRVDLECSRVDLLLARGFSAGMTAQMHVSWITIGEPSWDAVAEAFHRVFPVDDHYVRDLFARGQTFLYLRSNGRSILRREELARRGLGDLALSVAFPIRQTRVVSHRIAVTMELPTGRSDSLHGSGGVDAGVRWFATRSAAMQQWLLGAGITYQDPEGSFLGFRRRHTIHFSADYLRQIRSSVAFHAGARLDSSPLNGISGTSLSDPVLFYRIGVQAHLHRRHWISFDVGNEIAPQTGVDSDFTLHVGYGVRVARGNDRYNSHRAAAAPRAVSRVALRASRRDPVHR